MNVSEIKKLAKELQDYTRVVGSRNKHIQSVANRLVELTEQPKLNENQRIVIDLEMSDYSVEVAGWEYPEKLDTENLRYLFSNVLEMLEFLEQEDEK